MLPISVCIIAKNEEKYIDECLHRLSLFDWEIIVVDTGSTDQTVEIAKAYTPNVYHFDWINDFSAARNYSISFAKNDYILVVDCDEYLEADDSTLPALTALLQEIKPGQIGKLNLQNLTDESGTNTDNSSTVIYEQVARFFHKKHVHYSGCIHEQLVTLDNIPLEFIPLPLTFKHVGYSTLDIRKKKAERNIALLKSELAQNATNPYILFQLGQTYFGLNDYESALPYFEKALALDVNEQEDYVQTLVESYGYCLLYLQQYARALELEGIYSIFSKHADFVFLMGLIYMNNALFEQAIAQFLKSTTISSHSAEGANSFKAYYNIGIIYECTGNKALAMNYYKKCGSYAPALERMSLCQETK